MVDKTETWRSGSDDLSKVKIKKSQVCLWRDVSVSDLERLERTQSREDMCRALSQILDVGSSAPGAGALLDLFFYTVRFCWDSGFGRAQTSCILSVVKETLVSSLGSPLGRADECYRHFQDVLLRHAVQRPPFSIGLFSPQQLASVSDYFVKTFFHHFKLYKYIFTPQVKLDFLIFYNEIYDPEEAKTSNEAGEDEASGADGGLHAQGRS
ncbi:cilia- and flagella-associated protein 119 isoform X2 [Engystomops pustulosus]|uniref:cilia- and flagella-associated protein 119 isoform X2 n=1 Tax=Engystomops pustulosus TaxID=76066 RepID=UPI003AFA3113